MEPVLQLLLSRNSWFDQSRVCLRPSLIESKSRSLSALTLDAAEATGKWVRIGFFRPQGHVSALQPYFFFWVGGLTDQASVAPFEKSTAILSTETEKNTPGFGYSFTQTPTGFRHRIIGADPIPLGLCAWWVHFPKVQEPWAIDQTPLA